MNYEREAKLKKAEYFYIPLRILTVLTVVLLFFPAINPAKIVTGAGQANVNSVNSLFTSAVSYSSLVNGLERAFTKNWLDQGNFVILFIGCLTFLIGVILTSINGCMSVGNLKLKKLGVKFGLPGGFLEVFGSALILVTYLLIDGSCNKDKITYVFPTSIIIFIVLAVVNLGLTVLSSSILPKLGEKDTKYEMESKYKLFLMIMPFIALCFAFSYLPLFSWRYAFTNYQVGDTVFHWTPTGNELNDTSYAFVGFTWFKELIKNPAYVKRILTVLKNTLAMSALGLATSWLPMAFAIFLCEIKSSKYRRFVQTFTTIPNFISWVLIYAIAFAIFNTDGFINTMINSLGGQADTNYLMSDSHMWLKMLAWGTWKGVGWSAIIYISGISGIDQQLYEAATVDGAGRFQRMWHVTVPGLLPTYIVMLIMAIAGILSNGMDQYLVFTNANNKYTIEVLDLYVYNLGIGDGQIPLSTVVGMTKSIISVVLLFVANKASKLIRGESVV